MGTSLRHLWVETLSGPAALWAGLGALRTPTLVYCTAETRAGGAVLRMFGRLLGARLSVKLRDLDMGVTDETGHALYRRHELMLARLARSIVPDDPSYSWLPTQARPHGDLWCRVLASNFHDRWHPTIAFLVWVENLYRTGAIEAPADGVDVLITDGWLAHHLSREFGAGHATLVSVHVMTNPAFWLLYWPLPFYPLINAIRLALTAYAHPPVAAVDPRAARAGTILAQYHAGALDTLRNRGTLLWHESSGIENCRVIVMFDRPDSPMGGAERQAVESRGFGWITDMAHVGCAERPFRTFAAELTRMLTVLPSCRSSLDVARWSMLAYLGLRVVSCRKLLRRYNVRVCVPWSLFFTDTAIFALAAEYEGAIYLRWNRSLHGPFQNIFHRSMAHIAFVWGDYDRAFLRAHDFRYRLLLTTGVVGGDDADATMQRAVLDMRNAMDPRVSFVIGLFDTGYARKLYNNEAHVVRFYLDMLAVIRSHPRWGCIIKTKTDVYAGMPSTAGVQDVVAQLQREGRCIILDGAQPPSALAAAVDAVVCCNINMAGHLVAMHGRPALHLDYSGQYHVNWYDLPAAAKCFFNNAAAVAGALEQIERGDRSWGDASSWRDLLDRFQDGHARRRVGEAIRFYLDDVSTGTNAAQALDRLGEWYAARHGADTVCRPNDRGRNATDAWLAASYDKFYGDRAPPFPRAPAQI